MIVGLDDTDVLHSRGTNQLARLIVREIAAEWRCVRIVRHQLLDDPRVPYTSKNGSASITLEWRGREGAFDQPVPAEVASELLDQVRGIMQADFIAGSDPGLCMLNGPCSPSVINWGLKCKTDLVHRDDARRVAHAAGVHLESLGGTEDGVIGALAAVGLASTLDDGRIVKLGEWPDDLFGVQQVSVLNSRGVQVREIHSGSELSDVEIDVGKHLRPNMRRGVPTLFGEPRPEAGARIYRAIKLV